MSNTPRMGILVGGGPAPGINSAIGAAVVAVGAMAVASEPQAKAAAGHQGQRAEEGPSGQVAAENPIGGGHESFLGPKAKSQLKLMGIQNRYVWIDRHGCSYLQPTQSMRIGCDGVAPGVFA